MTDKQKSLLWGTLRYAVSLLLGLYVIQVLVSEFMALSQYKLTIGQYAGGIAMNALIHPFHNFFMYLSQKNPLLIILSIAWVFYLIYFGLKRKQKTKDWEAADTQTHGSATWGSYKELLQHYYLAKKTSDVQDEFSQSINQETIEQLKQRGGTEK
ncbi:hypothetical protein FC89_GL000228 [Liquorilactobacillus ghanensis DSM 18630]|uniref:Conjugal transfer protein n=1 Tax=Liquorilactobacillus ghanensis DSM 18630 TaxID=1423750 RepID=A0A0R1VQ48_9LACO|nr:hypothetical protein [Liquorilactobacillus ghanensis]KRM07541.1 hypothetical protein FC89_GL000228 [Liquorilactobacillus ghanensis DSM 18630]